MKDLSYLNQYRVEIYKDGHNGDEYNGAFNLVIKGEKYFVVAGNGMGWEHVSVSHKSKIPSWSVMCIIKDMFFHENETVMQLHPRKQDYVNLHPHCLHLWKPINREIPVPPKILV